MEKMIASKTFAGRALRIVVGITVLVILLSGGSGAVPVEEWNKTFGGNYQDGAKYVQQTSDGGFIIAGDTKSFGAGGYDAWLIKTDYKGNEQWRKTFGGAGTDIVWAARQTSDGGYVVAGQTNSYGGKDQVWIFKTDGSGTQQWSKTFGGNYGDSANAVQQTSDGGYIVAAYSVSCTDSVKGGALIIKTDNKGNQQWSKRFGGCGSDRADSLLQTSDGGYIFAGSTDSAETGAKGRTPWIFKTDSSGKWQWQKLESQGYEFTSINQASDGGFILSGTVVPRGAFDKAWLYKTDSNGNKQWSKTFGSGGIFKGTSVQQTADGGYALSAVVSPNAGTTEDGFVFAGRSDSLLIKTNATGEKQWNIKLGKDGFDDIYSVQQTTDGGYILAGTTDSYGDGEQAWLIKVSNEITPITLKVTATPDIVTAGVPTGVTFTVVNLLGVPQSGITVDLTGAATGSGTTDASGNVVINVNASAQGIITATASKTGFISASTRVSAIKALGTLQVTAARPTTASTGGITAKFWDAITSTARKLGFKDGSLTISAGTPTDVTFTVTNTAGVAQSGAKIYLTGAATGSGTTDVNGNVIINVNTANAGTITATASKFGFIGGNLNITVINGTPTPTPTITPTAAPTLVPTSVPTITSTATQQLSVISNPATLTAGTPAIVTFTVTDKTGAVVSGAAVTLTGAASGSGTTNDNGAISLTVNTANAGTITATASKTGFISGSETITAGPVIIQTVIMPLALIMPVATAPSAIEVWAWGYNLDGQLGDGSIAQELTPVKVNGTSDVKAIAAGDSRTVALKNDGAVWAWGNNNFGLLGDGTYTNRLSPVKVSGLTGITAIAVGYTHTVVLKNDGTVWAWGNNGNGQLGDGTNTQRLTPVKVSGLSDVKAITAGNGDYGEYTVALKNDGTVWAWGLNNQGQLGDGAKTQRLIPVQVSRLSDVKAIAAGDGHTVALKNDGTVWAWGLNHHGQLGNGFLNNSLVPVQVNGLTGITAIAAGDFHTVALKNDGTVWAWGFNVFGQLGNGITDESLTPVQVSGLTGISAIAAGSYHTIALKISYPTLNVSTIPDTVTAGTPASVTFTVTDKTGAVVSGAAVTLTGATSGSGTTDASGKVTITLNAASTGTITATASKTGFVSGSTIIIATSPAATQLSVASTPATITAGTPSSVTFTVFQPPKGGLGGGLAEANAVVTLTGAATGSGTTDANGKATITVNATSTGTITATARKTGFTDGSTNISVTATTTIPATLITGASPTIITLQGKLTNSGGDSVQAGSMVVTIYDISGAQLWQETFDDVIDNGVFNIPLGAIQELDLAPDTIYQMEVAIDAESATYVTPDVTFGDKKPARDVIKFKA